MSVKYHVNNDGLALPCTAKPGNCPFGGSESHFNTEAEAEKHSYKINSEEFGILPDDKGPFSVEVLSEEFPEHTNPQIEILKTYYDKEKEIFEETINLENSSDEYKATDEYFDRVQTLRETVLDKYGARADAVEFTDEKAMDKYIKPSLVNPEKEPYKWQPNKHPDITVGNFSTTIGPVIASYTGKSHTEIENAVKDIHLNSGERITLNEATRRYWNTLEQRTDKPIVSIDLETANPQDSSLAYDNGQLTHIIETGAIKTYPDGRVETIDFKSGIPEQFVEHNGTGFIDTHKIEPDMIKDEKEFVDNEEKQKEVIDFLDGSVMIAHNADFEIKQFTNSLRGFKGKLNDGDIEVLDTMQFSKYMVPESPRNTNEALVETSGAEYEGAHRAFQDAKMTLNAFNILKNNRNKPRLREE